MQTFKCLIEYSFSKWVPRWIQISSLCHCYCYCLFACCKKLHFSLFPTQSFRSWLVVSNSKRFGCKSTAEGYLCNVGKAVCSLTAFPFLFPPQLKKNKLLLQIWLLSNYVTWSLYYGNVIMTNSEFGAIVETGWKVNWLRRSSLHI